MANLTIKDIIPDTRIAVFKGSGKSRNYLDEDILFHNKDGKGLIFSKIITNLEDGDYAIRTIHSDMFFEHIDFDVENGEDVEISLNNKVDPTSVGNYESAVNMMDDYWERHDKLLTSLGNTNEFHSELELMYENLKVIYGL